MNKGQIIFSLIYQCNSILPISHTQEEICVKNKLVDHISNHSVLKSMYNIVSQFAAKNLFQENQTEVFQVNSQEQISNSIHGLNKQQTNLTLNSIFLLKQLLNKNFGVQPSDLRHLQISDLHLKELINKCKNNETTDFTLKSGILYKKNDQNTFLLALPNHLAQCIIYALHNKFGFHFSSTHMLNQLRKLIYTQNLKKLIQNMIAQCPVCILTQPKKLKRLCGDVRSNVFLPG